MHIQSCASRPRKSAVSGPQAPTCQSAKDHFSWSQALALPAYAYGTAGAGLSCLVGYAKAHPAGGITINPGVGVHMNPEWTRNFAAGALGASIQHYAAGAAALVLGVRGALEVSSESGRTRLAGLMDLGMASANLVCIAAPGMGILGAAFLAGRVAVDLHP